MPPRDATSMGIKFCARCGCIHVAIYVDEHSEEPIALLSCDADEADEMAKSLRYFAEQLRNASTFVRTPTEGSA